MMKVETKVFASSGVTCWVVVIVNKDPNLCYFSWLHCLLLPQISTIWMLFLPISIDLLIFSCKGKQNNVQGPCACGQTITMTCPRCHLERLISIIKLSCDQKHFSNDVKLVTNSLAIKKNSTMVLSYKTIF